MNASDAVARPPDVAVARPPDVAVARPPDVAVARPPDVAVARPGDMCDACGREVPPGEGHREELAVASSMCPAPMAFHDECWAVASVMWEAEPESYCEVDPLYPETGRWLNLPEPEGPSA